MNDRAERSLSGRIHDVCDSFEQAWKSNQRPSIVKYLKGFDGPQQMELLRELLLLDVDYRRHRGEDVKQTDYETEIPEVTRIFSGVIEEIANRETKLESSQSETRNSPASIEISPDLVAEQSAGRFEILKHHASGGLGDVFIARDGELNREVALKQIKEKFAHDEHNRSRFVVEAEFTGRLEHPGIVPVYGMGKYDDGRPYYAMRFVKGESLKDAIRSFHKEKKKTGEAVLELRKLLNRFVDVCNAVEYAHSRGVIHRDLKPENVMLGKFGETLVVDWGLAKSVDKKSKSEMPVQEGTLRVTRSDDSKEETQQGEVLGTPQYMSPEQAAGRIDELGPASDVYSLGAILFCLLTGQPPFEEAKSEGLEELLKAVRKGRFSRPREIDTSVPKPLEAICLKAMQTDEEERYESVKLLANDVEQYLADEPVKAHSEPIISRAARWARKHKAIVSSAAVLLVTSVIALSVSNIVIAAAHSETQLAHAGTKRQKERADENFQQARQVVDEFFTEVSESRELLKGTPGTQQLRKRLLERARKYYEDFILQWAGDEKLYDDLAAAHYRIALIAAETGEQTKALDAYRKAIKIRERLARENPTVPEYQNRVAASYNNIGVIQQQTGNWTEALAAFGKAHEIRERLTRENPDITEYQSDLALSYNNIGNLQRQTGKRAEAQAAFQKALQIQERLARENPTVTEYQRGLALIYNNIGNLQRQTGKRAEVLAAFQKAIEIQERLARENPTVTEYRKDLAASYNNIGVLHRQTGKPPEALAAYQKAIEIQERLARENPTVTEYRKDLAGSHYNIGYLHSKTGNPAEALAAYQKALEIQERLARENPAITEYQSDLAGSYNNIGLLHRQSGKRAEALTAYQNAIAIQERLARENPAITEYQSYLVGSYNNIGNLQRETGKRAEALATFQKAIEIREWLARENPNVTKYLSDLALSYHNIGVVHQQTGNPAEALAAYQKSIKIREQLARDYPTVVDFAVWLGESYSNLGFLVSETGEPKAALDWCRRGIELLEGALKRVPEHPTARLSLRNAHWGRALALEKLKRPAQAVVDWERAIELDTGQQSQFFRSRLGSSLARAGDHVRAAREAKALAEAAKGNGLVLYNAACIYSLSAAAATQDKSLEQTNRTELSEEYALHAINLLKRAQVAGFFKTAANVEHMKKNADLDPIREHEEFKKLLTQIETEFRAKPKKKSTKLPLIAPKPKLVTPKSKG